MNKIKYLNNDKFKKKNDKDVKFFHLDVATTSNCLQNEIGVQKALEVG